MPTSSFINSPEFKRASTNAADNLAKVFFKWLGILISSTANFIKSMIMMAIGK